jgi:16S rRNA U1498 N3-methylase RsmE
MSNEFEGIFELFDLKVRRLRNGNKISIILESEEDLDTEKRIIEFRGENVKANLTQEHQPEKKKDVVSIDDVFEIFDIRCRRLRNGDKLSIILETSYEKNLELQLVKLRYDNVRISFNKMQEELDFEEKEADIPA